MPHATRRSLLLSLPMAGFVTRPSRAAPAVTVFAAASLTDAVEEIAAAHEAETGTPVRISAAASSTLARQIEAGAPADIFLSANALWMDRLDAAGLLAPSTRRILAGNRLVIVAPAAQDAAVPFGDAREVLAGTQGRIAVGDPDHVPSGIYAAAALRSMGLWDALAPRLARADNARAAVALVARRVAPLGIVYATDAAVAPVVVLREIDPALHPEIVYSAAMLAGRDRPEVAALFGRFAASEGRAVLAGHGFQVR